MSTTEIRVRPVIRHVVTRFTKDERSAGSQSLGEFANEQYAEEVAQALQERHAPRQYVAVERGEHADTNAIYFDSEPAADTFVAAALEQGREFRVFGRIVTDPVARGRIEAGIACEPVWPVPPRLWHAHDATPEQRLADIPNLLRTIAREIEKGQRGEVLSGVVTLRLKGHRRPEVFGLGVNVEPYTELQAAAEELKRLGV